MRKTMTVSDIHVHFDWNRSEETVDIAVQKLNAMLDSAGYDKIALQSVPLTTDREGDVDYLQNLKVFYAKKRLPQKTYAFAGLIHCAEKSKNTAESYLKQAEYYMKAGFDGIKMLEGRPCEYKYLGQALDDPCYDLLFEYLENNKVPIMIHVGGPEHFWDRNRVDQSVIDRGWFMDDSFPTLEQLYKEVERVLTKHPKLHMVLAHFYFISPHMERAAEILDKWKNISYDLTPNVYMYIDFSKKSEEWREFFIKYNTRIIYGTDLSNATPDPKTYSQTIRKFLEEDKPFRGFGHDLVPLHIQDEAVLKNIYQNNMIRLVGKNPKPFRTEMMLDECAKLRQIQNRLSKIDILNLTTFEKEFRL